jgi:hypothetical protein
MAKSNQISWHGARGMGQGVNMFLFLPHAPCSMLHALKQSELFFLGGFFLFAGRHGDLFEAMARDFLDER